MENIISLIMTLVVGLFILVGAIIVFITKNNLKVITMSISMAFGVMIALVFAELIPETFILMDNSNKFIQIVAIIFFSIIGVGLLKLLDHLIPHHEHDHEHDDEDEDLENFHHIGIVASFALIIHNIIEGMALYATALSSISLGLMLCIGIGLHNIPMGLVTASTFYKSNNNKKKTLLIILLLSLSTFVGGLIMFSLKTAFSDFILGILVCITLGMIIYIALFELLPKMLCSKDKKTVIVGTATGILILFISSLF